MNHRERCHAQRTFEAESFRWYGETSMHWAGERQQEARSQSLTAASKLPLCTHCGRMFRVMLTHGFFYVR